VYYENTAHFFPLHTPHFQTNHTAIPALPVAHEIDDVTVGGGHLAIGIHHTRSICFSGHCERQLIIILHPCANITPKRCLLYQGYSVCRLSADAARLVLLAPIALLLLSNSQHWRARARECACAFCVYFLSVRMCVLVDVCFFVCFVCVLCVCASCVCFVCVRVCVWQ
jgi:hypothetical protein